MKLIVAKMYRLISGLGNKFHSEYEIFFIVFEGKSGRRCRQITVESMMGAIHRESPPEHWDNSMTTRTLL